MRKGSCVETVGERDCSPVAAPGKAWPGLPIRAVPVPATPYQARLQFLSGPVAGIALAVLLSANGLSAQEELVPRRLCAYADIANMPGAVADDELAGGIQADKDGRAVVHGVSFRVPTKALSVAKGGKLSIGVDDLKYAGDSGIESQMHRDRGPLVLHKIQHLYLLHVARGLTEGMLGKWVFEYADGTSAEEELWVGENIGTETRPADWGKKAGGKLTLTEIMSPSMDKKVKSLTFLMGDKGRYVLAALTCKLGRDRVHD